MSGTMFIGFTPDMVTAVWGGNDENQPITGSHVTGGTVMAGIWQAYMKSYYKSHPMPPGAFIEPDHPLAKEAEPIHFLPTPASIFHRLFGLFDNGPPKEAPQIKNYDWPEPAFKRAPQELKHKPHKSGFWNRLFNKLRDL